VLQCVRDLLHGSGRGWRGCEGREHVPDLRGEPETRIADVGSVDAAERYSIKK
jgi:hypothetical protein